MAFDFLGFEGLPSLSFPLRTLGVILLLIELAVFLAYFAFNRDRKTYLDRIQKGIRNPQFLILLAVTPIVSQLLLFRIDAPATTVTPGLPLGIREPSFTLLGDAPWFLAAGLLGPWYAAGIAGITGLFRALWDTHSVFTPIHLMIQSLLVAWFLR